MRLVDYSDSSSSGGGSSDEDAKRTPAFVFGESDGPPAFKTALAQDAFAKMKSRLSFGSGGGGSASGGSASESDADNNAQTSHSAFRPYDKAPARRRTTRGPQSGIATTQQQQQQQPAAPPNGGFPASWAAKPQPHASPFGQAAPVSSGKAATDARMDSPTSSSSSGGDGKKKPEFTFAGKQLKRRVTPFPSFSSRPGAAAPKAAEKAGAEPWSPLFAPASEPTRHPPPPPQQPTLADDAVMNEATAAVEFTNVFQRQTPSTTFHSVFSGFGAGKFAAPESTPAAAAAPARPVFHFGAADASARGGFSPFGAASPAAVSTPAAAAQHWPFNVQNKVEAATPAAAAAAKTSIFSAKKSSAGTSLSQRRKLNATKMAVSPSSQGDSASTRPNGAPFAFGDAFRFTHSVEPTSHQEQQQQPGHATSSRDWTQNRAGETNTTDGARRASMPARTHSAFVFGASSKTSMFGEPNTETNVFSREIPAAATPPPAAFTNPQVGSGAQFPFGMANPTTPFVFGRSNSFDERRDASASQAAAPRAGDFTFEPRRTEFTSSHRFSHKPESQRKLRTSFRVKATLGAPSANAFGGASSHDAAAGAATPGLLVGSPFGLKKPSTVRTSLFQQKRANTEYAAPADPFATPLFPRAKSTADPQTQAQNSSAPVQQKPDFTFESRPKTAPDTGQTSEVYRFGASGSAQQAPGFVFTPPSWESSRLDARNASRGDKDARSTHTRKQSSGAASHMTQPPVPGSAPPSSANRFAAEESPGSAAKFPGRRILRATRPSEVTRSTRGEEGADGDTSMGGDRASDGSEWGELKQLGGAAYSRRNFREAAELYRQSIEAIEVYLEQYPDLSVQKDKAKLHANRAASLMMIMQFADAQYECQQSIDADPTYTRAYIRLSRIQILFGDIVQARENLEIAKQQLAKLFFLNVDPADRTSIEKMEVSVDKLAKLQVDIKWQLDVLEWTKALKLIEEALTLAPNCRMFQSQKTLVLFKRKCVRCSCVLLLLSGSSFWYAHHRYVCVCSGTTWR